MFEGFERRRIPTGGAEVNLVVGGSGPPLLLLHGNPQTHAMWHKLAPALAERFTVVAADLRGYGDSGKPDGGADHIAYSKREMARDPVEAMESLGFTRFRLVGHDRGARVAHRLTLDHPERVERLALLDIIPTLTLFETVNQAVASAYYHWFFLIQPNGLPEAMIGKDPDYYIGTKLVAKQPSTFLPEARAEYVRCFRDPATIHAICEDYRAAAGIDLVHDRADRTAGRRVACPLLALWGSRGAMAENYDVVQTWREYADDVRGQPIDAGHFLAEENPEATLAALLPFLA